MAIELFKGVDFEVAKENVYATINGKKVRVPDRFVTYRTDTGQPLGIVSNKYRIVQHKENIKKVYDAVKKFCKDFTIKHRMEGAKVFTRFLVNTDVLVPYNNNQETAKMVLTSCNSYDRSLSFGVAISMLRMICKNLMYGFAQAFAFRKKHLTTLDYSKLELLPDAIQEYKNSYLEFYKILKGKPVVKKMTEKMRTELPIELTIEALENYQEHHGKTAWELYNEFTFLLTRRSMIVSRKDAAFKKVSLFFANQFQKI